MQFLRALIKKAFGYDFILQPCRIRMQSSLIVMLSEAEQEAITCDLILKLGWIRIATKT